MTSRISDQCSQPCQDSDLREAFQYAYGDGKEKDDAKAFALFSKAAARNVPEALFRVGTFYEEGRVVRKDPKHALQYYVKAEELGSTNAGQQIDSLVEQMDAKTQLARAVKWCKRAAKQGDSSTIKLLADCYRDGVGVPKNLRKAAGLIEKVMLIVRRSRSLPHQKQESSDPSVARVASLFDKSEPVTRMVPLFESAANAGSAKAQWALGKCYHEGIGVKKDDAKAAERFARSAAQGYSGGQDMLGYFLSCGIGGKQDMEEGKRLTALATKQGYTTIIPISGSFGCHVAASKNLNKCGHLGLMSQCRTFVLDTTA